MCIFRETAARSPQGQTAYAGQNGNRSASSGKHQRDTPILITDDDATSQSSPSKLPRLQQEDIDAQDAALLAAMDEEMPPLERGTQPTEHVDRVIPVVAGSRAEIAPSSHAMSTSSLTHANAGSVEASDPMDLTIGIPLSLSCTPSDSLGAKQADTAVGHGPGAMQTATTGPSLPRRTMSGALSGRPMVTQSNILAFVLEHTQFFFDGSGNQLATYVDLYRHFYGSDQPTASQKDRVQTLITQLLASGSLVQSGAGFKLS